MNALTPLAIFNSTAAHILEQHNCYGWTVRINSRLRTVAGKCRHASKTIEIASWLLNAPEEKQRDTLLHEVAHAIAGAGNGHNSIWRQIARRIGARPERCYDAETAVYNRKEVARVYYRCTWPLDGRCEVKYQRKPRRQLDDPSRFRCRKHGLTFVYIG